MKEREKSTRKKQPFGLDVHPQVFTISALLIICSVILTIIFHENADRVFGNIQSFLADKAGWFYVLVVNVFLLYAIYLIFSRFGVVRLGGRDAKPDFTIWGWFAMLFSAGMGIGLLFYSVAEPMYHFTSPPRGAPETATAAQNAMTITFYHWGLHAWGTYAVVGLALAFFCFNKGLPLTIRSVFHPILGDKIHGPIGDLIDILAVVSTLFGVATSLGLGVKQINAGMDHLFGIAQTPTVQVLLISIITAMATISVVLGLDGGIRRISEFNMWMGLTLILFVFILGPTIYLLNAFVENTGNYIQRLPQTSTWTETYSGADGWQDSWTIFYWAWWIAWSPFVGMFIARISRGRTIREFVLGVLLVPTLLTFIWLTIFGNSALKHDLDIMAERSADRTEEVAAATATADEMMETGITDAEAIDRYATIGSVVAEEGPELALFALLEKFPLSTISSFLAIVVVVTFFVTSSDSGSLVIDIITAGGNTDPPVQQRIFWAVLEGVVAASLLIGGGLGALQTAAITTGLPFAIVLVFMLYSLHKGLEDSYKLVERRRRKETITQIREAIAEEEHREAQEKKEHESKRKSAQKGAAHAN